MTDSGFFVAWVDNGAFVSLEAQIVFEETVGSIDQWNADLAAGEVTFEAGGTTRVMKAQVLGSAAPGPQSWLWSWANSSISQDATSVAQQLRSYGEQHGVPEFVASELPLGGHDEGNELWKRIAIAAGAMYPDWRTYFPAPIGAREIPLAWEGSVGTLDSSGGTGLGDARSHDDACYQHPWFRGSGSLDGPARLHCARVGRQ